MFKMKKNLLSFLLIITLVCNCSISVYASDTSGGGYTRPSSTTDTTGFNEWSNYDQFCWWKDNLISLIGGGIGCVFNPLNWNYDHFMSYLQSSAIDKQIADESTDYQEYIANRIGLNDSGDVAIEDELMDLMFDATVQYIEEETGFFVIPTLCASDLLASNFYNKDTYEMFKNYINNLGSDICLVNGGISGSSSSGFYLYQMVNGSAEKTNIMAYMLYRFGHDYGIIHSGVTYVGTTPTMVRPSIYDSNWNHISTVENCIVDFITLNQLVPFKNSAYEWDVEEGEYYLPFGNVTSSLTGYTYFTVNNTNPRFFTADGRDIRVYKTLDDFKNYSTGTRPYYVTEKFVNYDSTVDNSTTITQTDIDNSITYGDVYNYIINNYDNPDGLTEEELIAILEKYFGNLDDDDDGGGSGSGGSDDDDDEGGSGLSGFLDGLGALGDAILAIVGKLLEYVGKAIELLSGTVTKVIDLVPQNITALLTGLFPFIPEEWVVGIELSIVLAVIIGIVGIFKK